MNFFDEITNGDDTIIADDDTQITVGQLKSILEQMDENAPVLIPILADEGTLVTIWEVATVDYSNDMETALIGAISPSAYGR